MLWYQLDVLQFNSILTLSTHIHNYRLRDQSDKTVLSPPSDSSLKTRLSPVLFGVVEKISSSEKRVKNKILENSVVWGQTGKGVVSGNKLCLNIDMVLFWKIHDNECLNLEMLVLWLESSLIPYDSVNMKRAEGWD